jgi:uncharacterized protein involved in exopolysaccharide biosynthesis
LLDVLAAYPKRWLVPAALVTALVAAYAVIRPNTWEASQALIVRNEAATGASNPGKFSQPEEMKTIQETILELARSRGVLAAALADVGPTAKSRSAETWPADRDVAELRDRVTLSPPKGAEFGKTEIFYLKVRDNDHDRAIALADAITRHLESSFQKLRDAKAQSMIGELAKAVSLSAADLENSTKELTRIETEVGSDLAELRILHDSSAGESALRRSTIDIRNELRQARSDRATYEELLALLQEAEANPDRLLAAPNRLLESQPALRQMKDGLVNAGLQAANLQGRMSAEHPLVRAALEAQRQIEANLRRELPVAVRGIEAELRLNADRVALLENQLTEVTGKLGRLAALRASYSNQVAQTQNRKELLQRAEDKLAEARTSQATANTASLIARIDRADTGSDPIGPSRATLALLGLAAGLVSGLGIVFLTVPLTPPATPSAVEAAEPTVLRLPVANGKPMPAASEESLSLKCALQRLYAGQAS